MELQRLYSLTRKAIDDYKMISEGDSIAVGISGGKDSLTLLYALAGLRRFYPEHFDISAFTVDLGFEGFKEKLDPIKNLCEQFSVPYTIVSTPIAEIIFSDRKEKNPCSLCAKMRKGALNDAIKALNCNKVAYAHHKDDVVETSNGTPLYDSGYFEINTDNSYLIYNRAKSGFTTKTWNRGDILQLTGTTHDKKIMISDELAGEINTDNKYLFFNETCHGYTVRKWENYIATTDQEYNVVKDLKNNAFSLKYNNDGSISYRYLTNYCEDNDLGGENPISGDCETYFNNGKESGWTVIQETSLPGLIEKDKWNVINVMFKVINGNEIPFCKEFLFNYSIFIIHITNVIFNVT